jgi:LPXTG-site transpeptidase (sortase) family protein
MMRAWLMRPGGPGAPPGPERDLGITCFTLLAALIAGFLAQVTFCGTLKYNRDQQVAYDDLRLSLAEGTGAVGPVEGKPIPLGKPVARIEIPAIGVKDVVLSGTTAGVLRSGPGHRRDSVLPGQAGTSVVMGRRMAYGGPFGALGDAVIGDLVEVTTGQGVAQFRVIGTRYAGDQVPPMPQSGSRLTLVTASGPRFAPDDAVRVDADLVGTAFPASTPFYTAATLPKPERTMAGEPRALGGATAWGILLLAAAIGTTWLRTTWGRWQAWLIGVPVLGLFGAETADYAMRLLPNLL